MRWRPMTMSVVMTVAVGCRSESPGSLASSLDVDSHGRPNDVVPAAKELVKRHTAVAFQIASWAQGYKAEKVRPLSTAEQRLGAKDSRLAPAVTSDDMLLTTQYQSSTSNIWAVTNL